MARSWRPPAGLVLFAIIVVGVVAWIGSGMLEREPPQPVDEEVRPPITVAARWSDAEPVERLLTLYGDVEPNQVVIVRAETSGRIAEVNTRRGALVQPGNQLAQLALGDRPARLRRAQAQLAHAQQEYERAAHLVEEEVAPPVRLETAAAELEAARADVESIEEEIENTTLRAPIVGVVNRLIAEVGDFVAVGGTFRGQAEDQAEAANFLVAAFLWRSS
jgi:membrane fusion protein, multidrug efflux system